MLHKIMQAIGRRRIHASRCTEWERYWFPNGRTAERKEREPNLVVDGVGTRTCSSEERRERMCEARYRGEWRVRTEGFKCNGSEFEAYSAVKNYWSDLKPPAAYDRWNENTRANMHPAESDYRLYHGVSPKGWRYDCLYGLQWKVKPLTRKIDIRWNGCQTIFSNRLFNAPS